MSLEKCSICRASFAQPVTLPCQHTFCRMCIVHGNASVSNYCAPMCFVCRAPAPSLHHLLEMNESYIIAQYLTQRDAEKYERRCAEDASAPRHKEILHFLCASIAEDYEGTPVDVPEPPEPEQVVTLSWRMRLSLIVLYIALPYVFVKSISLVVAFLELNGYEEYRALIVSLCTSVFVALPMEAYFRKVINVV